MSPELMKSIIQWIPIVAVCFAIFFTYRVSHFSNREHDEEAQKQKRKYQLWMRICLVIVALGILLPAIFLPDP